MGLFYLMMVALLVWTSIKKLLKQHYFFKKANLEKIKVIVGPALNNLIKLRDDNQIFDMIFIDADKENYKNYFNLSIDLVKKSGFILIDNVLWKGDVTDLNQNDNLTNIIREFNLFVKKDDRIRKKQFYH